MDAAIASMFGSAREGEIPFPQPIEMNFAEEFCSASTQHPGDLGTRHVACLVFAPGVFAIVFLKQQTQGGSRPLFQCISWYTLDVPT